MEKFFILMIDFFGCTKCIFLFSSLSIDCIILRMGFQIIISIFLTKLLLQNTRKSQQTKNEPSTTSHVSFTHFRSNGSQEMWLTLLASPRLCRRFPRFPGVSALFLVLFLVWRRLFWGPIPASSSSWTSDCQRGNVNRIALCGFNLWQNI